MHISLFSAGFFSLFMIYSIPVVNSQVVLSEIMFNPLGSEASDEFIEIVNISDEQVDLSGWQVGDGSSNDNIIAHEAGLLLNPGQFALVLDPTYFENSNSYDAYIPSNALIVTIDNGAIGSSGLSNSTSEMVALIDPSGGMASAFGYTVPNAGGISEEKIDLLGPDVSENWRDGKVILGTPGGPNSSSLSGGMPNAIIINEIMYSPAAGESEWIEIVNLTDLDIDLTRWAVSDQNTDSRTFILNPVTIAANSFLVLAPDSSILNAFDPPAGSLLTFPGMPGLNNDSDSVIFFDLLGNAIDSVGYKDSWGGDNGISLEKIRPDFASNDSSAWTSSVAVAGGTPGERNSVFIDQLPAQSRITANPNPFSPNGDGQDDFTLITFELPLTSAAANVKIFDLRGRLIRYLANNKAVAAQNTLIWDGMDDNGQLARIGIYVIFLQAINAQAGILETQKSTVVLAQKL